MNLADPAGVQRIALVGTGVIGSGWAAHFLRLGMQVTVHDPAPGAEVRLRRTIEHTWPVLERLGVRHGGSPHRLQFSDDLAGALQGAVVVQESAPERPELKKSIIESIAARTPASTVIISSTSGLPMTFLQAECRYPERCVVGHPFNPPYLVPLVEVVPGEQTDPQVTQWTVDFYSRAGKLPLLLSKEYPAFLANRLLEAVWREALHLVKDGLATVQEIDRAMTYAPALRWAVMGPFMIYHLAGGEGGMSHFLDHFGPSLQEPWSYMQAPVLTPELRQNVIDACEEMAGGRTVQQIAQERDECLIAVLEALERCRPA